MSISSGFRWQRNIYLIHSCVVIIIRCIIYQGVIILPQKPQKPCGYPGCPELIREGRYCPAHKAEMGRQYNTTRDPDFNQRYGRQWRKIRALYISKHPLCEECEQAGRLIPATEAHHIIPLVGAYADRNEEESILGLTIIIQ